MRNQYSCFALRHSKYELTYNEQSEARIRQARKSLPSLPISSTGAYRTPALAKEPLIQFWKGYHKLVSLEQLDSIIEITEKDSQRLSKIMTSMQERKRYTSPLSLMDRGRLSKASITSEEILWMNIKYYMSITPTAAYII